MHNNTHSINTYTTLLPYKSQSWEKRRTTTKENNQHACKTINNDMHWYQSQVYTGLPNRIGGCRFLRGYRDESDDVVLLLVMVAGARSDGIG